ncbi:hypothetical protein [Chryseobacterium paludis]|uniref:hypothetical protein n=1 Tax=Chryseobacterium paludis TaxID=2956784 RepID=UPI0021BF614A|nr:hypothetical protein [Chryseobacterium paludis]
MRKIKIITNTISILLLAYLLVDLVFFRINTMPILTQIKHDDFIKEAENIKDLAKSKTELKKWINERYRSAYSQNDLNVRYLYIVVSLFLINVFNTLFNGRNKHKYTESKKVNKFSR